MDRRDIVRAMMAAGLCDSLPTDRDIARMQRFLEEVDSMPVEETINASEDGDPRIRMMSMAMVTLCVREGGKIELPSDELDAATANHDGVMMLVSQNGVTLEAGQNIKAAIQESAKGHTKH